MTNPNDSDRKQLIREYMAEHGVRYNVARRALDEASEVDPWDGFTPEERARRRWNAGTFSGMIAQPEAALLSAIADQLGRLLYDEAIRWGDEPVIVTEDDASGDSVLARLPRCTDRQDQAWRVRMARAFCDLAGDLSTSRAPIARNHAEDLALILAMNQARETVELAKAAAADPAPGQERLDAAGHLAIWHPKAGRVDLKRHSFDYHELEEALGAERDVDRLWSRTDGLECPDHPLNKHWIGEDMRPERWFDTFATTVGRDPARGFPSHVWNRLTEHAQRTLDQDAETAGPGEPAVSMAAAPVVEYREPEPTLGRVTAENFLVAGWRQEVLTAIGQDLSTKRPALTVEERKEQAWDLDGRAVFSDIPEVAVAQARRLLPRAVDGDGEVLEVLWTGVGAHPEWVTSPRWFRIKVVGIDEHPGFPLDTPALRFQWASLAKPSPLHLSSIIAIRRPTGDALSPWEASVAEEGKPFPTLADYTPVEEDAEE